MPADTCNNETLEKKLTARSLRRRVLLSCHLLLASLCLGACGTVVKNPKQPKPTGLVDLAATILGQWLDELHEGINAPGASLRPQAFNGDAALDCTKPDPDAAAETQTVEIRFNAAAQTSHDVQRGADRYTVENKANQTHTHRWTSKDVTTDCTSSGHLNRGWQELGGMSLTYDFTLDSEAVYATAFSRNEGEPLATASGKIATTVKGTRSLLFTEQGNNTLDLTWNAEVTRRAKQQTGPAQEETVLNFKGESQEVTYHMKEDAAWSEVVLAAGQWKVETSRSTGGPTIPATIRVENLKIARSREKVSQGACFPESGTLSIEWENPFVYDGAQVDKGTTMGVDFSKTGIPSVSDQTTTALVKTLWCLN